MSSMIGQTVGAYVVKELIGRGKMSMVYRAEHPEIGRQVAIKMLAPHLAMQPQMARRFKLEARMAAMLQHPNVIDIYSFGTGEHDVPYYVMELLRGRTLAAEVLQRGQMNPGDVFPYVKQICAALALAHERGVVHRGLRPSNILVVDAEMLLLKILDFGIARMLETDEGVALTSTGVLLEDPAYIAPEQAAKLHDGVTTRTDIYSLGTIIYWMLCGEPPFAGHGAGMIMVMQMRDPPPPLLSRRPDLPRALAELVHRCLAKEPGERPGSVEEVVEGFREALSCSSQEVLDETHKMIAAMQAGLNPFLKSAKNGEGGSSADQGATTGAGLEATMARISELSEGQAGLELPATDAVLPSTAPGEDAATPAAAPRVPSGPVPALLEPVALPEAHPSPRSTELPEPRLPASTPVRPISLPTPPPPAGPRVPDLSPPAPTPAVALPITPQPTGPFPAEPPLPPVRQAPINPLPTGPHQPINPLPTGPLQPINPLPTGPLQPELPSVSAPPEVLARQQTASRTSADMQAYYARSAGPSGEQQSPADGAYDQKVSSTEFSTLEEMIEAGYLTADDVPNYKPVQRAAPADAAPPEQLQPPGATESPRAVSLHEVETPVQEPLVSDWPDETEDSDATVWDGQALDALPAGDLPTTEVDPAVEDDPWERFDDTVISSPGSAPLGPHTGELSSGDDPEGSQGGGDGG